jgi:succinyl-CoA synthetase alpha subunit
MSKKAAENLLLLEEDSDVDAVIALVGQIYGDEDEELIDVSEAASRTNETYAILQTEDCM